jgi:hypothetical protein
MACALARRNCRQLCERRYSSRVGQGRETFASTATQQWHSASRHAQHHALCLNRLRSRSERFLAAAPADNRPTDTLSPPLPDKTAMSPPLDILPVLLPSAPAPGVPALVVALFSRAAAYRVRPQGSAGLATESKMATLLIKEHQLCITYRGTKQHPSRNNYEYYHYHEITNRRAGTAGERYTTSTRRAVF